MKRIVLALLVGLLSPSVASAAIVYVGAGALRNTTGNGATALPAGYDANDTCFVVSTSIDAQTHSISSPAGWTQLGQQQHGTLNQFSVFWRRMAGSGETDPTVARSTSTARILSRAVCYHGASITIDPTIGTIQTNTTSAAGTLATATPAVTTTVANSLVLHILGFTNATNATAAVSSPTGVNGTTFSPGFSAGGTSTTRDGLAIYSTIQVATGSSGTSNLTTTQADKVESAHVILPVEVNAYATITGVAGTGFIPSNGLASTATDVLAQPPNARNAYAQDSATTPVIIADKNPAGAGDLFGLFYGGTQAAGDVWYLLTSSDKGATWTYRTSSNGEPNADTNHVIPNWISLTQDTTAYKVHYAHWDGLASAMWYSRVALAYDGSGHISGWSWETQRQAGPAFNATASGLAKVNVQEVIDGSGNHRLMVLSTEMPSASEQSRLSVAVTTVAAGLAPTATAHWVKPTNAGAGFDVLGAYWTGAGTDAAAAVNFNSQTNQLNQHSSDMAWAQLPADKSLHFFFGPYWYNDSAQAGDVRRWRMTSSGTNWALDGAATGVAVASSGTRGPTMGSVTATANYVWAAIGTPAGGFTINKIGTSGTWTAGAITSPQSTADCSWYMALSVAADETNAWAVWMRYVFGTSTDMYSGWWNGTTWSTTTDTSLWARNDAGGQTDPVSWLPMLWSGGAGAMGYLLNTYGALPNKYHLHTAYTSLGVYGSVSGGGGTPGSATLTAVSGAGAVASVSATGAASKTIAQVSGTGAAASVSASGAATATLAAATGTGAVASITATGAGTATITATAATGAAGTLTSSGSATATLTATSGVGVTGTVTAVGGSSIPGTATLTAVSSTGATGSVTASGSASATLTTAAGAGVVAGVTSLGAASATLSGVAGSGAVLSVSATGGNGSTPGSATLSAVSGTGTAASLSAAGGATASLTTTSGAGMVGSVTSSGGGSATLTGSSGTGLVASVTASGGATATLTLVAGTGAVGAVIGSSRDLGALLHAPTLRLVLARPALSFKAVRPALGLRISRPVLQLRTTR